MRKVKGESMKELSGEDSGTLYFPTLCIDGEELPEAKEWKVGKTYVVTLKLKMSGMSQRATKGGKTKGHFDFDIVAVDPKGEAPAEKKTRYT